MFVGFTFHSNDGLNEFLPPSFTSAQLHVEKDQFPEAMLGEGEVVSAICSSCSFLQDFRTSRCCYQTGG